MLAALSLLVALVPSALATIYVTQPTPSLPCVGGQPCTIIWAEDQNVPTLSTIGLAEVGLWVGSQAEQVELQQLSASVEVAKTGQLIVTIDPKVGGNMDQYFIRFSALSYVDPASQYGAKYSSFSSKFTLSGMTGSFDAKTQSLIDAGRKGEVAAAATTAPATTAAAAVTSKASSASAAASKASGAAVNAAASASSSAKAASSASSSYASSFSSALVAGGAVLTLVLVAL